MHIFGPHPGPTESRLGKHPVVKLGGAGGKAWSPQGPLCTVSKGGGGSPKGCRARRGPAWEGGPAGPTVSLPPPPGPGGGGPSLVQPLGGAHCSAGEGCRMLAQDAEGGESWGRP